MQEERILYKSWRRMYLQEIIVSLAVIAAITLTTRVILFNISPVWHEYSFGYEFLSFVNHNRLAFIVAICMLTTTLITLRHFRRVSVSVVQIADAVEKIYIDEAAKIELTPELRGLETMLKRISLDLRESRREAEEAVRRKNDMMMYMAHDLKTPLASVIGYSSLLEDESDLPASVQRKYIGIIHRKALRLEDLINEFFDIARFNFTRMVLNKRQVNLSMMLSQMLAEFTPMFESGELNVKLEVQESVNVTCDVDKMERVFDNLFKNIVSYAYRGSDVNINLETQGSSAIITTKNSGPTIPPEMLPHIFDQFFRVDSSRNSESGGSGLGLAAVREIIELHGGAIDCESNDENIIFRISLPCH